ncbi:putative reverse transcriptase domain-containing protein, partial [Tanacetum coccineum]
IRSTDTSDGLAAIQAQLNNLGMEINKVNERVTWIFKSNQSTIPFPSWLIDDYEKMDLLDSATYLKSFIRENPRIGYQIEASTYMNDSGILEESLSQKEKDPPSLGELAPTKLIIELADRIIKHPKGVAENVLVGIDKFVFPVDFIVLDMPEDIKVSLILRRPFLFIAHAKINVFKRKISLKIGNDKFVFKSDKPISNIIKRVYVLGDVQLS